MSVFSGKQGRKAMRKHHANKVLDAFRRQLARWSDDKSKYVYLHPLNMIPVADRYMYEKQFQK